MRVLIDQGLQRSLVDLLRRHGHDAVHVAEIGLERSGDAELLILARQRSAVIITRDIDFHSLLAVDGLQGPSVISVIAEHRTADDIASALAENLDVLRADRVGGCMVTTDVHRARVRRLPVL